MGRLKVILQPLKLRKNDLPDRSNVGHNSLTIISSIIILFHRVRQTIKAFIFYPKFILVGKNLLKDKLV